MKGKERKEISKEAILLVSIVIGIILFDQAIKIWIQNIHEINIIPNVLDFKIVQNPNDTSGEESNSTLTYIVTNVIVLGVILKFILTQNQFVDRKLKIFLCFALAGGISNVIDKMVKGYVVEYIDFTKVISLPIFNIADIFVLIGWLSVVAIFTAFTVKERNNKK